MIGAKIMLADDTDVASVWLNVKPAAGEILWLNGKAGDEAAAAHGTRFFTVLEVAHWAGSEWSPATHLGQPVHSLALYVQPCDRDAARMVETEGLQRPTAPASPYP